MSAGYVFVCIVLNGLIINLTPVCYCGDITKAAFGDIAGSLPAAFGDFNSDELTDLFVIHGQTTLEILLGSTVEPYFQRNPKLKCQLPTGVAITSVVPGDFDGDALMDALVTAVDKGKLGASSNPYRSDVYIFWGGLNNLTCSDMPLFAITDEPLAIDFNRDMIVDLFVVDEYGNRGYWLFRANRTHDFRPMSRNGNYSQPLRVPHSHAFIDLNDDNSPDLYLTGIETFEVHLWNNALKDFVFDRNISFPPTVQDAGQLGQTLFMDVEIADKMDHVLPVCFRESLGRCVNSTVYVYSRGVWYDVRVNFRDAREHLWGFAKGDRPYFDTVTVRGGDYNMDGYPDMLVTLRNDTNGYRSFLLLNTECVQCADGFNRSFDVQWDAFQPTNDRTVMGVFYDFLQDGIVDVVFVCNDDDKRPSYNMTAYKNSLDYDANFIKVMVITGLTNNDMELEPTLLGAKRHTFGTNMPGPKIRYKTTTQEGVPRAGISDQLPQSAHFAMYLPYTIFGLGRTPNFVEDLTVGIFNESRTWTQIIPNSQLVVIPFPPHKPSTWRAQLFVTPSKIILQSVIALLGVCLVILIIIAFLHLKEKREDRIERSQEAQRFHFDAM